MANGSGPRSATSKYSTEMRIFVQATEEYEPFIVHHVVVPSSHELPMIMSCAKDGRHGGGWSRSLDIFTDAARHINIR